LGVGGIGHQTLTKGKLLIIDAKNPLWRARKVMRWIVKRGRDGWCFLKYRTPFFKPEKKGLVDMGKKERGEVLKLASAEGGRRLGKSWRERFFA